MRTLSGRLAAALLTAIAPALLNAQTASTDVGVTVAVNSAKIHSDAALEEPTTVTRFMGGVSFAFAIESTIAIQPELVVTQKGTSLPFGGGTTLDVTETNVEVPLLLKAMLPMRDARVKPSLLLGAGLGINTSCRVEAKGGSETTKDDCTAADIDIKTFDAGLILGVQLDVGRLALSGRYELGLTDITRNDDANAKNQVLSLGARFSLWSK
jgi:Outer membrane protein beta-barrel domain